MLLRVLVLEEGGLDMGVVVGDVGSCGCYYVVGGEVKVE